jgi:hypothetical protein
MKKPYTLRVVRCVPHEIVESSFSIMSSAIQAAETECRSPATVYATVTNEQSGVRLFDERGDLYQGAG